MLINACISRIFCLFLLLGSFMASTNSSEFLLSSPALTQGKSIPAEYTCDGLDISPPLEWNNTPKGTKSFVLIMDDPDAPVGMWDHWLIFNIPVNTMRLEKDLQFLPKGAKFGKNSWKRCDYGGPCPPDREHRYFFKIYALDTELALEEGASKQEIESAMRGHILAEAQLMARYDRPNR